MALKRRTERRAAARPENATQRFVVFRVGEELYGLEISGVREIDRLRPVTRVPQSLSFVEGVVNLRGTIIPVIDLARRFGREAIAPDRRARIVIAGLNGQLVKACVQNPLEYRAVAQSAVAFAARPHDLGLDARQAAEFCTKMMG